MYGKIANAFLPEPHRQVSLALVAKAMGAEVKKGALRETFNGLTLSEGSKKKKKKHTDTRSSPVQVAGAASGATLSRV